MSWKGDVVRNGLVLPVLEAERDAVDYPMGVQPETAVVVCH